MIYCDDSDALSQMLLIGVRPEDVLVPVSCHMTQIHMSLNQETLEENMSPNFFSCKL